MRISLHVTVQHTDRRAGSKFCWYSEPQVEFAVVAQARFKLVLHEACYHGRKVGEKLEIISGMEMEMVLSKYVPT